MKEGFGGVGGNDPKHPLRRGKAKLERGNCKGHGGENDTEIKKSNREKNKRRRRRELVVYKRAIEFAREGLIFVQGGTLWGISAPEWGIRVRG